VVDLKDRSGYPVGPSSVAIITATILAYASSSCGRLSATSAAGRAQAATSRDHAAARSERAAALPRHIDGRRVALFDAVRGKDLEGVVAKWKHGRYHTDGQTTSWFKISNLDYSQIEGRRAVSRRVGHCSVGHKVRDSWFAGICSADERHNCAQVLNRAAKIIPTSPHRLTRC